MMLAEAFAAAKSAGCRLIVAKLDGVLRRPVHSDRGEAPIFVDVALGIVRGSWVKSPT